MGRNQMAGMEREDTSRLTRHRSGEHGQALVELGLILTVMCLLILGAVDMGRLYGTAEQLTNAAHEGAKLAGRYYSARSGYGNNPATIARYVKNQVVQEGLLDANSITGLTVTETPYSEEEVVSVTVQYRFTFLGPWSLVPGLSSYSVSATSAEVVQ